MSEFRHKQKLQLFCAMNKIVQFVSFTLIFLFSCTNSGTTENAGNTNNNATEIPQVLKNLAEEIKKYPDSTSLRLQLATAYDSIGHFKEAVSQMDSLTLKDSLNYGLWFAKGEIAEDAADTSLAVASFIKAIKVYPSPDAMLALAELYAEQKNAESILICGRVKNMELGREKDADCAFITGIYFARTGDKNAALKSFDECVGYNYTYMEAYIEKGLVYFDNKQYDDALKVFSFATTVNNLYADAYYYQARCYEMMNKKDSAILKFQQSLGLDKNLQEAHEGLNRLGAE